MVNDFMETENKTLIEQPYIARKSSFFGLFHHFVYMPTNSRISDYSRYYGHVVRDEMAVLPGGRLGVVAGIARRVERCPPVLL